MNSQKKGLEKGKEGEKLASNYLQNNNIKIIEKNFRTKFGEIDIIGLKDKILIFYEVKLREIPALVDIHFSINKEKQKRLFRTAQYFLLNNVKYQKYNIRFDAILIEKHKDNVKIFTVENIINADKISDGNDLFY